MGPEPGEISARYQQQIKLKCGSEKNGIGVAEYEMKNETGDKQDCEQKQRFIKHAHQAPPKSRCGNFHYSGKAMQGMCAFRYINMLNNITNGGESENIGKALCTRTDYF